VGFQIVGRSNDPAAQGVTGWAEVSADYFETFRIPMLHGRTFTERDQDGPPVVILNQALARQFWGDGDPLNGQIAIGGGPPIQIIGVAGDVRDLGLNRDPRPGVYVPSISPGGLLKLIPWVFVIRTRDESRALSASIERQLTEATGGLPVGQVRTMDEIVSRSRAAADFNTLVMTIFGCSALLLAAVGIYGLLAYSVAQRRGEIGIRLALGADSRKIRGLVVRQGLRPAVAGMTGGLAAAFGMSRWLSSLLFGVKSWDPLVFSAVPILLLLVALAAVWAPARRASRVDPIKALRYE
jgi:predicted permease